MRGLYLSDFAAAADNEIVYETNQNIFMERLLFPKKAVCAHILVPTQFGIFLNGDRLEQLARLWKLAFQDNPSINLNILARQDAYTCRCAQCYHVLRINNVLPYQLVLRIVGAREADYESTYDIVFAFFCRRCQTTQAPSLLVTDETAYVAVCTAIAAFAFTQTLYLNMDGLDVVGKYLERFDQINRDIPAFLSHIVDPHTCFHCAKRQPPLLCEGCKSLRFCNVKCTQRHSHPDPDIGLCNALKNRRLFHVQHALYVDDSGNVTPATNT